MAHGGGGPAGAAAAAQYVAAQAAAGFGVPGAAAAGFTIPAQFAGAQPAAADLQAVNIQHEHLVMTWRIPRRCVPRVLRTHSTFAANRVHLKDVLATRWT